jgi:dolichyl-phosphate-mannose--protein O-mannosyl transferase
MGLIGKFVWIVCFIVLWMFVMTLSTSFPQYGNTFAILFFIIIFSPFYLSWIFKFIDIIIGKKDTEKAKDTDQMEALENN